MKLECAIVDVFAERPLAGNQLAVVRGAAGLDDAAMQAIAREMNFSETAFVFEESADSARVRIFTVTRELPFAGHRTIGTAWVLGHEGTEFSLDLPAGRVPVTFNPDGIAWMEPPPVQLGGHLEPAAAAALLGIGEADVATSVPPRFATVGPSFVLVGVRSLDALRRIRINAEMHEMIEAGAHVNPFVFTDEAYNADADFAARMLMAREGREDPATGSANTAFAAYLRELGRTGRFIVEQGFEIARPSRLYLDVGERIRVGGRVQQVLSGTLQVPITPQE